MASDSIYSASIHFKEQNHSTVEFIVRNDEGKAVGKLMFYHKYVIDQNKRQGEAGRITNPGIDLYPQRFVLDRPIRK